MQSVRYFMIHINEKLEHEKCPLFMTNRVQPTTTIHTTSDIHVHCGMRTNTQTDSFIINKCSKCSLYALHFDMPSVLIPV